MSTSAERVVVRDLPTGAVTAVDSSGDLRRGVWTRLGGSGVRGDLVTEATLASLAERAREAARAQGFAAGWAEGRRRSDEQLALRHDEELRDQQDQGRRLAADQRSAAESLRSAAGRAEQLVEGIRAELADQAVELALQIAEAVLGRELATSTDPARDAIRHAVHAVPLDVSLVVRLHPDDLAVLDPEVLVGRTASFLPDPAVSRGDAVVETETGSLHSSTSEAMGRVREVLGR